MHRQRHHHRRTRPARTAATVALVATFGFAACGDDDDESANPDVTSAATEEPAVTEPVITEGGTDEFCTLARELNEMEGFPTVEQIEEYAAAAPDEIQQPVAAVLDLLRAADGNFAAVFADPAGGEALEQITAVEAEQCGLTPGGGEDAGPPQDPSVTVLDPEATRVDVEAIDYEFHGDMPTSAGRYSFVMTNAGEEPHIMVLVRLEDGSTLQEALESEGEQGVAEEFESAPAMPGGEGVLTADLGPGNWVLLCPIPDGTGTPHFASGMIHEFEIA
jgi:hypothetical protein